MASLIEAEAQGRRRPGQDRPGHLQPAATGDRPRHRRHPLLRPRPTGDRDRARADLDSRLALQHPDVARPAADADRHPGRGLARGRPRPGRGPWLYYVLRRRSRRHALLHRRPTTSSCRQGGVRRRRAWLRLTRGTAGATRLAAVIGVPVRHSLSPAIHNAAFAALGLDWVYVAFAVAPGGAAPARGRRCGPSASPGCR